MTESGDGAPLRAVGGAGPVLLIGGAEDKFRDKLILSTFAELTGGADGHVVVISTASSLGGVATATYRDLFLGLGIGRVSGIHPEERRDADEVDAVRLLSDASGIFLTGGNQSRLTQVVGGTRMADAIANAHDRGVAIAGTSAGASALGAHMVAFGRPGPTPKNRMVHLAAGLGIVPGVVIDQHFEQRGRIGRLLALVAQSPSLLGVGIDEDTCAIVAPGHTLSVVGRGAVTIVDGSHVSTDAYRGKGYRPVMVSGAVLHSLPSGYRFDMRARALLPTPDAVEDGEAST
jgi:cyanophycinase